LGVSIIGFYESDVLKTIKSELMLFAFFTLQADIKRAAAAPKLAPESNLNGERRVDLDMMLGSN